MKSPFEIECYKVLREIIDNRLNKSEAFGRGVEVGSSKLFNILMPMFLKELQKEGK